MHGEGIGVVPYPCWFEADPTSAMPCQGAEQRTVAETMASLKTEELAKAEAMLKLIGRSCSLSLQQPSRLQLVIC